MTKKIQLFEIRDFSAKFSATFDFVRQNWRVFLRMALYLWLPLSITQGIFLNTYYSALMGQMFTGSTVDYEDMPWAMIAFIAVVSIFSLLMIWAVTYGLMKLYEESDGDLSQLTLHDFMPTLRKSSKRACIVMLAYVVLYVAFVIAAVIAVLLFTAMGSVAGTILIVLLILAAIVALMPPLMLFPAVYLLDYNQNWWEALKTSFSYGFKTWGGLFAVIFVFGIIIYAVSGILMAPALIMSALKSTLFPATFTGSGMLPLLYTIIQDIIVVVTNFIAWLFMPLPLIAVGFHYGHAAELFDGVSVADDIDHFEELADNGEDTPELEEDKPELDENNPKLDAPDTDKEIDDFNNL